MEANNLGSKKINGVQKNIDESKGKNISHDEKTVDPDMKKEVVTDSYGNKKIVERARNENEDRNSDITPNRYPNSNPESHEDRGNMKLDE